MNKATPYAVRHLDSVRHPEHSEGSLNTAKYHNAGGPSLYSGRPRQKKVLGFTLFECLWVMLIISILCCLALPSIRSIITIKKPLIVLNDVTQLLQFARIQATLRRETLALRSLASNNNWAEGAVLFVDNKTHRPISSTQVIHVFHWRHAGMSMVWHGFASKDYLLIYPSLNHLAMNGYFEFKTAQNESKKICVSRLGELNYDCV